MNSLNPIFYNMLLAPSGCLQYFPETSGSFESLNYGGGSGAPYLANTKYAVCFRGAAGFCGIKFSALPGEFIVNSNNGLQDVGEGSECHNYTVNSNNDFLQVLGAWTLLGTNKVEDAYFCGGTTSEARSDIYGNFDLNLISYDKLFFYSQWWTFSCSCSDR